MVGDIKQSIYSFRGAVPEIFNDYRVKFSDYDDDTTKVGKKIFLSNNFRSSKSIIDFDNIVFGRLFNSNSGRIVYDHESDKLILGRKPDNHDTKVSVNIINNESITCHLSSVDGTFDGVDEEEEGGDEKPTATAHVLVLAAQHDAQIAQEEDRDGQGEGDCQGILPHRGAETEP